MTLRHGMITLVFNGFWLLCVLGKETTAVLSFLLLLMVWAYQTISLRFIFTVTVVGIVIDMSFVWIGAWQFSSAMWLPYWLALLWAGFSSWIWLMRSWLLSWSYLLIWLFFAVGGASSYWAGISLSAVSFIWHTPVMLVVLSTIWGCFGCCIVWFLNKDKP